MLGRPTWPRRPVSGQDAPSVRGWYARCTPPGRPAARRQVWSGAAPLLSGGSGLPRLLAPARAGSGAALAEPEACIVLRLPAPRPLTVEDRHGAPSDGQQRLLGVPAVVVAQRLNQVLERSRTASTGAVPRRGARVGSDAASMGASRGAARPWCSRGRRPRGDRRTKPVSCTSLQPLSALPADRCRRLLFHPAGHLICPARARPTICNAGGPTANTGDRGREAHAGRRSVEAPRDPRLH